MGEIIPFPVSKTFGILGSYEHHVLTFLFDWRSRNE